VRPIQLREKRGIEVEQLEPDRSDTEHEKPGKRGKPRAVRGSSGKRALLRISSCSKPQRLNHANDSRSIAGKIKVSPAAGDC
jgi:hypothetical protein